MKRFTTSSSIVLALGVGLALFVLSTQAAPALSEVAGAAESHGTVPNAPAAELHVCPSGCTYSSIQDAVDAASDGDVIKVATGVYTGVQGRPAPADYEGPDFIDQVVYINKTVTIRGGYTTAFTDPPDPKANPTTLDAQQQGRVLFITGAISVTVEGLRITGGDAAELGGAPGWWGDAGGGVYVLAPAATIRDNWVFSNTAEQYGGGLYLQGSDATLSGNTVSANTTNFHGGGLYLVESDATLSGNTITANAAGDGGGLVLFEGSDATLSGNTISNNIASSDGGGVYVYGSATFSGNTVTSNTANGNGGGLCLREGGATLSGNTFTANTADSGGGLYLKWSDAILTSNVVADNQAGAAGSGLYIWDSSLRLLHTTVARNTGGDGSGVHVGSGAVALTNTILVSHTVGITVAAGNTATLEGTLWGSGTWTNGSDWGGDGTVITGTVNLWDDPAFVDPDNGDYHIGLGSAAVDAGVDAGVIDDMDGQLRPMDWGYDIGADEYLGAGLEVVKRPSAIFVNRGVLTYTIAVASVETVDATDVVLTDTLDGWQRPITATSSAGECTVGDGGWGGTVVCAPGTLVTGTTAWVTLTVQVSTDAAMGQVIANTVVVTANETTNSIQVTNRINECHLRINDDPMEYTMVQIAVDAANPGDLVKAAGYCLGVNERGGHRQQVYLDKSITIRGGYTTTNWTVSDPEANPTTLDAEGQGRVLYITPPAPGAGISPTVEGLRITGGDAGGTGSALYGPDAGGGVYIVNATATLRDNCVFSNTGSADGIGSWGGGLYLHNSATALSDNAIFANTAGLGGGLYLYESPAELSGNTIFSNSANGTSWWPHGGGGLFLHGSAAILAGNTVISNTASEQGGGLLLSGSNATLSENIVTANTASEGGGLALYDESDATLDGNTIFLNTGGGLSLQNGSDATLNGNTISSNTGSGLSLGDIDFGGNVTLNGNTIIGNSGDGLSFGWSEATLTNNVIADNGGRGLYISGASLRLLHTTIARNRSGVYVSSGSAALTNTILVSHTVGISITSGNTVMLEGTLWGSGAWANEVDRDGDGTAITGTVNIWSDPAFVDPDDGDYHIGPGSAAIDAGVDAGVTDDIDGDPRYDGHPDIGADETVGLKYVYLPLVMRDFP